MYTQWGERIESYELTEWRVNENLHKDKRERARSATTAPVPTFIHTVKGKEAKSRTLRLQECANCSGAHWRSTEMTNTNLVLVVQYDEHWQRFRKQKMKATVHE